MDIKVGDYVRTKNKGIKKIDHLNINPNATVNKYRYFLGTDEDGDRCYGIIKTTEILKYSKDIIDLIEIGDIIEWEANDIGYYGVNEVIRRPETKKTLGVYPEEYDYLLPLERLKIIKVLTREQFEENSYEVK